MCLAVKKQNIKQKQYCNTFNKDFKNSPHPNKNKNLEQKHKPGQGNSTHRGRNELDLFEEQRSQCGWRVGSRGKADGRSEVPAGLPCLEDCDTHVDFLPGQQQAAIGSQM